MNIKNEKNTIGNSVSQRLHKRSRLSSIPNLANVYHPAGIIRPTRCLTATLRKPCAPSKRMIRRPGVGTYITRSSHVIESGLEILESLTKLADRLGCQSR